MKMKYYDGKLTWEQIFDKIQNEYVSNSGDVETWLGAVNNRCIGVCVKYYNDDDPMDVVMVCDDSDEYNIYYDPLNQLVLNVLNLTND